MLKMPRVWLLTGLVWCLLHVATAVAMTPPPGSYTPLPQPERYSASGKVEVVEVFSYGCIHCAELAPTVAQWQQQLPPQVEFKLVPALFNMPWLVYARAFYAARQLGLLPATHLALFQARFEQHQPLDQLDSLAGFYAGHGANPQQFVALAQSPEVWQLMRHDALLAERWGIDSTPTFIVNGRYKVSTDGIHSYAELLAVVNALIADELAAKH